MFGKSGIISPNSSPIPSLIQGIFIYYHIRVYWVVEGYRMGDGELWRVRFREVGEVR